MSSTPDVLPTAPRCHRPEFPGQAVPGRAQAGVHVRAGPHARSTLSRRSCAISNPASVDGPGATRLMELFVRGEHVCAAGKALAHPPGRGDGRVPATRANGQRRASARGRVSGVSVGAADALVRTAERLDDASRRRTEQAFRAGQLPEARARRDLASPRVPGQRQCEGQLLRRRQAPHPQRPEGGLPAGCRRQRLGRRGMGATPSRDPGRVPLERERRRAPPRRPVQPNRGVRTCSAPWTPRPTASSATPAPRAARAPRRVHARRAGAPDRPRALQAHRRQDHRRCRRAGPRARHRGGTLRDRRCRPHPGHHRPGPARRRPGHHHAARRRRDHPCELHDPHHPRRAAPLARSRLPHLRTVRVQQHPTPADRPHRRLRPDAPHRRAPPPPSDNTWRLCPACHALKTYRGWQVIGGPGTWTSSHPTHPTTPTHPEPTVPL